MKVFCFPYAGGSAQEFSPWTKYRSEHLELVPVEIPGRGRRFGEESHRSLKTLVPALAREIQTATDGLFAFFGHSMGALLVFELCRFMRQSGATLPVCLFISGSKAPHLAYIPPASRWYNSALPEFVGHLRSYAGCPPEMLENPELMEVVLPYLRADLGIAQSYEFHSGDPLPIPICAFGGDCDPHVSIEDVQAWLHHTTSNFHCTILPGDHFFFRAWQPELLHHIASCVLSRMAVTSAA
ncbi:MAG TPA: alpha/beta fold hydrolase [Bryobacteraceae bacterium]|nr:alpha/beta fold hydrolase [Bryobacteraceae bacterium]